jgi:hypothetical protein
LWTPFGKLGKEMSDLQTQVKTEGLEKRLAHMQTELQNTQRALAPAPKAKLAFSFFPFDFGSIGVRPPALSKDVTVTAHDDNKVDVEISVLNMTDVDALDGEYTILICDDCKYANQPNGFVKGEGRPDKERYISFSRIPAKAQFGFVKLSLEVPPKFSNIPIGITYRCRTCEVPVSMEDLMGTVHVIRNTPPFPNQPSTR